MGKPVEDLMSLQFGGRTVAENIDLAIATGKLVAGEDGSLTPGSVQNRDHWAKVSNRPSLGCQFLMSVLFQSVYAESAVPHGCRTCFKVKVVFNTLRELVAGWGIAKTHPFSSKWGVDIDNKYSQSAYAGYYYVAGLEEARSLYWTVRDAYAKEPKLGPDIVITIKRGCSDYEAALGPSDAYQFTDDQADLEAQLKTRFRHKGPDLNSGPPPVPLALWMDFAFRSGDDTYLDFTGGKRLQPKTLAYDPGERPTAIAD